jgi:hypothetical protein
MFVMDCRHYERQLLLPGANKTFDQDVRQASINDFVTIFKRRQILHACVVKDTTCGRLRFIAA